MSETLYSLGFACRVREGIQRYYGKRSQETGVFDWISTNFNTVLYLLSTINTPLSVDDFYDTCAIVNTHRSIAHKKIHFIAWHDVDKDKPYNTEMVDFIAKYNRRLQRLNDKIKSEHIDFVHVFSVCNGDPDIGPDKINIPTIDQINNFISVIQKINPSCSFTLNLLVPPPDCNYTNHRFTIARDLTELLVDDRVALHYLSQDDMATCKNSCQHWSWSDVFDTIVSQKC